MEISTYRKINSFFYFVFFICLVLFYFKQKNALFIIIPTTFILFEIFMLFLVFTPPENIKDKVTIQSKVMVVGFVLISIPFVFQIISIAWFG